MDQQAETLRPRPLHAAENGWERIAGLIDWAPMERRLVPLRAPTGHPSPVRRKAIEFLGLAGGDASAVLPRLEVFALDADEDIRKEAAAAIERIKNGERGEREDRD